MDVYLCGLVFFLCYIKMHVCLYASYILFDASGVMNEFHSIFLVGINFFKDLGFWWNVVSRYMIIFLQIDFKD